MEGNQKERKTQGRKKEADYEPKGVHQKLDPVEHMQLAGQRNFYGACEALHDCTSCFHSALSHSDLHGYHSSVNS